MIQHFAARHRNSMVLFFLVVPGDGGFELHIGKDGSFIFQGSAWCIAAFNYFVFQYSELCGSSNVL